jgi:acetyl esterase/lipase
MLPDATVRYADHDDAVIDLHLPASTTVSAAGRVVVLLHGGFWNAQWDRRHTRPMARALAELGWLVATPEYRRVGNGGGWPTTGDDVHLAVSRLPELLAGLDLPVGPLSVTGHSAGGHLALWLATTGLPIEGVVALAPVCDLREATRLGLGSDATQALLGDSDPGPADPMGLFDVRPPADIAIVHGDRDEDVPVSLSRGFVAAHPFVGLHELPGVGHMDLIDPGSGAWPTVVEALQRPLVTRGSGH